MTVWEERNTAFQEKRHRLTQEQTQLERKLQTRHITDEQIQDIQDFAQHILESINLVDEDFKLKRRLIEMLNVQVMLFEDPQDGRYAQVTCLLGDEGLSIASIPTRLPRR